MNQSSKIFTLFVFFASSILRGVKGDTQFASTCIFNTTDLVGVSSSGAFFTDFTYLFANELSYIVYRMSAIQICQNASGDLTGMRATITKYSTSQMTPMSTIQLNRIGSVTNVGITCLNLTLSVVAGEYIS